MAGRHCCCIWRQPSSIIPSEQSDGLGTWLADCSLEVLTTAFDQKPPKIEISNVSFYALLGPCVKTVSEV